MVLEKMPHSFEGAANPPPENIEHPHIISDRRSKEARGGRGGKEDICSNKRYHS